MKQPNKYWVEKESPKEAIWILKNGEMFIFTNDSSPIELMESVCDESNMNDDTIPLTQEEAFRLYPNLHKYV